MPDSAATNYLLADALFESQQYADRPRSSTSTPPMTIRPNARSAEAGYAALVAYQKDEDALPPEATRAACICRRSTRD